MAVNLALEALPNLCVLVNNAGVYGPMGLLEDNDWDDWVQAVQINLFGTVLMCRAVIAAFSPAKLRQDHQSFRRRGDGAVAAHQRLCGVQGRRGAVHRNAGARVARCTCRRQRHRPGAIEHAPARRGAGGRAGRVGQDFYERSLKQRRRGRAPARQGRGPGGVPGLGRQRRHHRPAAQRRVGRLGTACGSGARRWPRATFSRCGGSSPEDRGEKWHCA